MGPMRPLGSIGPPLALPPEKGDARPGFPCTGRLACGTGWRTAPTHDGNVGERGNLRGSNFNIQSSKLKKPDWVVFGFLSFEL
jgi:hypothetical protein